MAKKFLPLQRPDDDKTNRMQHEIAQSIDSVILDINKNGAFLDEINTAVTDLVAIQNQVQETLVNLEQKISDVVERVQSLEEA